MSARFDTEVLRHLNEMYRERFTRPAADVSASQELRPLGAAAVIHDFDDEETFQPRRLHLRVF